MPFTKSIPDQATYNDVDREGKLTTEQIEEGWIFCSCEWDGMLINKSWFEYEYCTCGK